MNNTVKSVKTTAKIIFSNGVEYTIPFVNVNSQSTDLQNYGTKCTLKQSLYKGSNTNVIGNICSSTLAIEGRSLDKLLISSNEDSIYYNYMNNTAKIEIRCTGDDNVTTLMGTFYVDTWECGTSSSEYDTFYISCVDLLAKIKNISLHKVRIKQQLKFSEYLKTIIDTLNRSLPNDMQINYTLSTLQRMDNLYSDNWQMYYNNIDRDNIETIFNTLAQNTLSYIWIDRTNTLQIDTLLDDDESEAVCDFSGLENLFSYEIQQGDIGNYSGLSVEYIESIALKNEKLLELQDYQLYGGLNEISSKLSSAKTYKITLIDCNNDAEMSASCVSYFNYKDEIDMTVSSTINTEQTITVYGETVEETYDRITKYANDNNKNNVLEIKNYLLRKEDIHTYVDNFLRLMTMKNSSISCEGWINPQVKLSDMVGVTGSRLVIDGFYKVTELEYNLGTNYRCKAKMMKTIEGQVSVWSLLERDNEEVMFINGGTVDTGYAFYNPTPEQEPEIEAYIGPELAALQEFL